jgi:hypothetical protein
MDKDIENYQLILKNYTQAVLTFEKQRTDEKDKLEGFLDQMSGVFEFIDSLDYQNADTLFTKQFDPSNLATSVELIADASEIERWILRQYRELIINRLNSYTKNRKLIYDLLLAYFMQFLNCFEEHSNVNLQIQRLMLLSALGIQSSASESFITFLQGPLANVLQEKKKELERSMNAGPGANWKQGAVK